MLPDPALTFTIPSLHDGTLLDCRVHHPVSLAAVDPRTLSWRRHAAIVAHPYAPMGGCYDDAVVEAVAGLLLRQGYLVGAFNFRGAGHSGGRTSWTAKPERDDYASFVGFMVYYANRLHTSASDDEMERPPVLLMSGYSYGAMVTAQLGPLEALLAPFEAPAANTEAAEIRLRAEHLAEQQNLILGGIRSTTGAAAPTPTPTTTQQCDPAGSSPSRRGGGVRVGGDEGSAGGLRRSHESLGRESSALESENRLRKGVRELLAKGRRARQHGDGHFHRRCSSGAPDAPDASAAATTTLAKTPTNLPVLRDVVVPRPAYMLVSPLQGLVMHLATMSLFPSLATAQYQRRHQDAAEAKLVRNPTLTVYGNKDVLLSASKLRAWAGRLAAAEGSLFREHEVASAGHFWAEAGVLEEMVEAAGRFAGGVAARGRLLDGLNSRSPPPLFEHKPSVGFSPSRGAWPNQAIFAARRC